MPRRAARTLTATVALATLSLAAAARADAFIYWTQTGDRSNPGSIGRANLNGTHVIPDFIRNRGSRDDPGDPFGVAVNSDNIYWANQGSSKVGPSIGIANLNGTQAFGTLFGVVGTPAGVALTSKHVLWANQSTGGIGRALNDGRAADERFIGNASSSCGLAADASHIYWTTAGGRGIGRANLDGTGVNTELIHSPNSVFCGVAVDAEHIYWATSAGGPGRGAIGRANLDGTNVDKSFVAGIPSPCGVAVDRNFVYWGSLGESQNTIGRARVADGKDVNPSFIAPLTRNRICGVAVDARTGEPDAFRFGKVRHNRARGTVRPNVRVDGPGKIALHGTANVHADRARKGGKLGGKVRLRIRARGNARRRLAATGRARVLARVRFRPRSGEAQSKSRRLSLLLGG